MTGVRPLLDSPVELAGLFPRNPPANGFTGGELNAVIFIFMLKLALPAVPARARPVPVVLWNCTGGGPVEADALDDTDDVETCDGKLFSMNGRTGTGAVVVRALAIVFCSVMADRRRARADELTEADEADTAGWPAPASKPPPVNPFARCAPLSGMSGARDWID